LAISIGRSWGEEDMVLASSKSLKFSINQIGAGLKCFLWKYTMGPWGVPGEKPEKTGANLSIGQRFSTTDVP
jgi:hypothetical protein